MKKVVFIAKTNLNTDGRILNQLRMLQMNFTNLYIDFILFEDRKTNIDIGNQINIHSIKTIIRNNSLLRLLTVIEFSLKAFLKLIKLRPDILHVQDSDTVLPVLCYWYYRGKKFKLIYDDHELPNENMGWQQKIFTFLEVKLMKQANQVFYANQERLELLQKEHNLYKNKLDVFLNLPYFEELGGLTKSEEILINELEIGKSSGIKYIIHQGVIGKERGREKLAEFSKVLPLNVKIMLLGISVKQYETFIQEFKLDKNNFHFVGLVNYHSLSRFWKLGYATIIMYLPNLINNKLCAPNRFYIALKQSIQIYINEDNPVLNRLIYEYSCGDTVENIIKNPNRLTLLKEEGAFQKSKDYEKTRNFEVDNFISVYNRLIDN